MKRRRLLRFIPSGLRLHPVCDCIVCWPSGRPEQCHRHISGIIHSRPIVPPMILLQKYGVSMGSFCLEKQLRTCCATSTDFNVFDKFGGAWAPNG